MKTINLRTFLKLFFVTTLFLNTDCSKQKECSLFNQVSFSEITSSSVRVNWECEIRDNNFFRYIVKRDSETLAVIMDRNVKTYLDTGLSPNTKYLYSVRFEDECGYIQSTKDVYTLP